MHVIKHLLSKLINEPEVDLLCNMRLSALCNNVCFVASSVSSLCAIVKQDTMFG